MSVPEGYVDPADPQQVRDVLVAVFAVEGAAGIFDLLGRLPDTRRQEASAGGFLRRAAQPVIWLGDEHQFTLEGSTLVHGHVVRGVVLQHEQLRGTTLTESLATLITRHVGESGHLLDAAAALTAIRDLTNPA